MRSVNLAANRALKVVVFSLQSNNALLVEEVAGALAKLNDIYSFFSRDLLFLMRKHLIERKCV